MIRLEKARFASFEQVFFWVGVEAPNGYVIAPALRSTCRLIVTRPDGTQQVDSIGWPIDGPGDAGWRGGHRLGPGLSLGHYTVAVEFAGQTTPPASFTVEDVPVLKDIDARFVLPSLLVLGSNDSVVTLVVRNGSDQTIRFPHRGAGGSLFDDVSVGLDKTTGARWGSHFFVPVRVLLDAAGLDRRLTTSWDRFGWDLTARIPTVTVPPGETFRLGLPLSAVVAGRPDAGASLPPGDYTVTFSTTLELLIGEPDGAWATLSPIRIPVTSVGRGAATGVSRNP
jgi:hypothetical protein